MKYLWLLLPIASIWLPFGLVELLDLQLVNDYGYIDDKYTLIHEAGWYGFPYLVSSLLAITGSMVIAITKVSE